MPEKALKDVAAKYHLSAEQAAEILRLLDSGYSIPYIMRYHKELAAGLQADGFYELIEEKRRHEKLQTRRRRILKKLKQRDILTEELEQKMNQARTMRELVDCYVPFRPRKRSRSRQALSQGLGPLAVAVFSQEELIPDMGAAAEPYVDPEKELNDVESVLQGVFHIVSDWVAEEKSHRDRQRGVFRQGASIVVKRAARSLPGRLVREFRTYFDFRQKAEGLHPYQMLTILRGKRLKVLDYHFEGPVEEMGRAAAALYLTGGASQFEQIAAELGAMGDLTRGEELKKLNSTEFLVACIKYSLQSILLDVAARELEQELRKRAEALALDIIRRNVRSMLMVKPVVKPVLGIHPGYRTGCKLAAVDDRGNVLETTTVYPHAPQNEAEAAKETISRLINEHNLGVLVIGDGTAAEETENLVSELIAEKFPDLRYAVLSEVGIETYSTSRAARNELPDVRPEERRSVALCRRLLDPLFELVKISPRVLCPAPYVDEVNGAAWKEVIDWLIEECVCEVGVDVNTAHCSLLRYVSGLGPEKALAVAQHREKNGPFKSREQLRDVPKIDEESYDRAVGFIRVEGSENPLDVTRVHPRFYPVAEAICTQLGVPLEKLRTEEGKQQIRDRRSEIKLADLEKQFDVHYLLLKEMIAELGDSWPDPREHEQTPHLRQRRLSIQQLEPEQWLTGVVRNIADFGVFVDIGVGEDGLIHISELSDKYVQSPYDIVSVGDLARVRVVRVDKEKGRIALSMRAEGSRKERPAGPPRQPRPAERAREAAPRPAADVPAKRPSGAVRTPKSTVGWESRRVQKAALAQPLSKTQQQILKKREPGPVKPDTKEQKPEQKPETEAGGLPGKLGFATIERRGKPGE